MGRTKTGIMKGFIEHLIVSDTRLERELERDLRNTEVPYMADAYLNWLVKEDGKTENVAKAYISYLRSVDNELFVFEEDFFESLRTCFGNRDRDGLEKLFDRYEAIIDEWLEDSKKDDVGIKGKNLSNWRSGFRSYRRFILGCPGSSPESTAG